MNWSTNAWLQIEPIYQSIIKMPFIEALMDGTLPIEKFQFYITQDSFYLESYGRALALIAARAQSTDEMLTYVRFAESAIVVERSMHESFFKSFHLKDRGKIEPTCHHYTHYLKSTAALEPVEVAMAAILPCFWIYKAVGDHIYQYHSKENPYQIWIDTYAGEAFGLSVKKAIETCDAVASKCTALQQQAMTEAFVTASSLEYHFWDSAYALKRW
jgi:thiaminase/transcriptional activator TenA